MKRPTTPDLNAYEEKRLLYLNYNVPREYQLADQFLIHFMGMAHAVVGPEWGMGGKEQSDYLHHIDISLSGVRQVIHCGRTFQLNPGEVWLLPGNMPVQLRCEDRAEAVYFSLLTEWLPGVDPLLEWTTREPRLAGTCDIGEWRDWLNSDPAIGVSEILRIRGKLASWVASAIPELEDLLSHHLKLNTQFTEVFGLIKKELGANLSLARLAQAHGTTIKAFSAAFTRSMKVSPSDYVARRLNEQAVHLVINSNLRMKEIADKLKFTDEFYFSRFFKKMNGESPSLYRRKFGQL